LDVMRDIARFNGFAHQSFPNIALKFGIGMKFDRRQQLAVLNTLQDRFPGGIEFNVLQGLVATDQLEGDADFYANLVYLQQHNLVSFRPAQDEDDDESAVITHHGIDFLADDGGLSAVLGVVTIRLHSDTIKDLIEAKIAQSDLAPADKKRWIDQLRSLPADATKHLVQKLVEKGLDSGPAAVAAIGAYLKSQGLW